MEFDKKYNLPVNSKTLFAPTTAPSLLTFCAHPKSISLTCMVRTEAITMLSGCKSKWAYPRQCKYCKPSNTYDVKRINYEPSVNYLTGQIGFG